MNEAPEPSAIQVSPELQHIVDQARDDVGDASRLKAIAARLEPQLAARLPRHGGWLPRVVLGAVVVGVGFAVVHGRHRPAASIAASELPPTPQPDVAVPFVPAEPRAVSSSPAPPKAPAVPARRTSPVQPVASPRSSPEQDPVMEEHELLARGRRSLDGRPDETLERVGEHQKRYPDGVLASEREFLRISALIRLGRASEARAARDAFVTRWPVSAYRSEIDRLLGL